MPFITISGGLTLKVPTRGTTDWDTEFLNEFATPISNHQHTGSGDGAQLGGGSLQDDSLDDRKIRLRNNEPLRSRNFAGSGDVNILKVNASDEIEVESAAIIPGLRNKTIFSFTNNQSTAADVTGISIDSSTESATRIKYAIKREGTANLYETGLIELVYNGTDFNLIQEFSGDNSGVTFSITAAGQLQYVSSDNAGSSSELMYILQDKLGD